MRISIIKLPTRPKVSTTSISVLVVFWVAKDKMRNIDKYIVWVFESWHSFRDILEGKVRHYL